MKRVLIVVVVVLVIAGAAAYFGGFLDPYLPGAETETADGVPADGAESSDGEGFNIACGQRQSGHHRRCARRSGQFG